MSKTIFSVFVALFCASTNSSFAQQGQGPVASDIALDTETDVSSVITTGSGYEAWSGAAQRQVTDFSVPGAVSEHGLQWTRTYSSATGWSFSYTWRVYGQPFGAYNAVFPDGRSTHFGAGCKERLFQTGGIQQGGGTKQLYLADGSMVNFDWLYDPADPDTQAPTTEYITPLYVQDRYGRQTNLDWEGWGSSSEFDIHLVGVYDPTGRWIKIYYTYTNKNCPSLVVGSDGHWVQYTWRQYTDRNGTAYAGDELTHVDYSDGSSADYTYAWLPYWPAQNRWTRVMMTARDTHADNPMQSVAYDYNSQGVFPGQVLNERYFDGVNAGVNVSSLTSNATRGALNSIQTETRGDGPTRTIKLVKLTNTTAGRPFVTYKTDYNGVQEKYGYNGNYFVNQITDRNGNITNFTLESIEGNPTRKTHPDTTHIDYTYSDSFYPYYINTVTDENGKMTTYSRYAHSTNGNPVINENMVYKIDYPSDVNTPASSEHFYYNTIGQLVAHQMRNGAYQYFNYDSSGLLTDTTNPTSTYYSNYATNPSAAAWPTSEPATHFSYYTSNDSDLDGNAIGNAWQDRVKTKTPPANAQGLINAESYEYDRVFAGAETNPSGAAMPGRGLVTRIKHNWDGSSKRCTYDVYGNKKSETDELGHKTTYTYDDYMRLKTTTLPDTTDTRHPIPAGTNGLTTNDYTATNGSSAYSHTTKSITTITGPQGCGAAHISVGQTFDNNLRLFSRTEAPGTPDAGTTLYGYDANGNQTSITDPRNNQTIITYDTRNRKTKVTDPAPLSYFTQWFYDNASNVTSIRRKDGTTETKTYDAMNRVKTDRVPKDGTAGAPTSYITTSFSYDAGGTVHSVTDGNGLTSYFTYNERDLKTSVIYPTPTPAGTATPTPVADRQNFAYDNVNNVISRQLANQSASPSPAPPVYQIFAYDGRNRKMEMGWYNNLDGTGEVGWVSGIEHNHYEYDFASRLTKASNGFSTVYRDYWEDNRVKSDRQVLTGGIDKTVLYHYDAAAENLEMHVDDGNGYDRDYCYDFRSRLKTICDHNVQPAWFTYTYDAASNVTSRINSLNGVTESVPAGTTGYDVINRLLEKDQKLGASTFAYEKYGYDAMSRMTTVDRDDLKRDTLGYNLNGEMTSANYQWQSNRQVNYTLDYNGNRTGVSDAGVTKYYTPDYLNRYSTADSATANSNNVISGPEHQIGAFQGYNYQYIADSYVASITGGGSNYNVTYDALGRCVKRMLTGATNLTTYYVYDGEKPILEYTATGAIAGKNVYGKGIDEILMRTDYVVIPSGKTYYYQEDHEGSVTHLTDGAGVIIESYHYDAFGAPTIKNASGTVISATAYNNRFLFTGREYIQQFGIYEYRARTYHPGLGRFLSEDPKGFDAGDYNLFRYCMNDPEDHTDPTGMMMPTSIGMMAGCPVSDGMGGSNPVLAQDIYDAWALIRKEQAKAREQSQEERQNLNLGQMQQQRSSTGSAAPKYDFHRHVDDKKKEEKLDLEGSTRNGRAFPWKVYEKATGTAVTGQNWVNEEIPAGKSANVKEIQYTKSMPLNSTGGFTDQLSLGSKVKGDIHTTTYIRNSLYHNGVYMGDGPSFRQDIYRTNGRYYIYEEKN